MTDRQKQRKSGAALIEFGLVMGISCLFLFGLIQVSYLIMSRDVISFTAFAAARSATVGCKEDFVERVVRAASIPTAGPSVHNWSDRSLSVAPSERAGSVWERALSAMPKSTQFWAEKHRRGHYIGWTPQSEFSLDEILNYYNWEDDDTRVRLDALSYSGGKVGVGVSQDVPLTFPFASLFYRANPVQMERADGVSTVSSVLREQWLQLEYHADLYLE